MRTKKLETLGQVLAVLRANANLSLREAASRASVSTTFLMDIEHGRRMPTLKVLQRIAKALGGNPATLIRRAARDRIAKLRDEIATLEGR